MTPAQKRQLLGLFKRQKGRCHWCGCKMQPPGQHKRIKRMKMNPRLCTYDHLDDRWSDGRGKHSREFRNVAACWQCNTDRGAVSQEAAGIDEVRRRSGSYPLGVIRN